MELLYKLGGCAFEAAIDRKVTVLASELWKDKACLLMLFRRFGCQFCRLDAVHLSRLKPALDKRHIRLAGVGFDAENAKAFIDGNFFSGELYLDPEKSAYKALSYGRQNPAAGLFSLLASKSRARLKEANAQNIAGNLEGEGFQTGGLLAISKGGDEVLYHFIQTGVAQTFELDSIMKAYDINSDELLSLNSVTKQPIEPK